MCGLVGIFDSRGRRQIDAPVLGRMNDSLRHRGPDGDGFHLEPGLGLGHQRLAIIDIEGGTQPMYSPDRTTVVVFNGEIYNFQTLRTELEGLGHRFRTRSDTEVILHAYAAWGSGAIRRLEGMFALALWDSGRETLLLARDRLGKKPLYYTYLDDGHLLFGSELKALLCHPAVRGDDLDPTAIEDYFAYGYIADPKTILRGVHKLPPAHILQQRRGEAPRSEAYWDVSFGAAPSPTADIDGALVERLGRAVQDRLVADVPLGAFLSGGVDSGAVVAMMAGRGEGAVKTFTIGFEEKSYDESAHAEAVARRYRTEHVRQVVGVDDFGLVRRLPRIYDEPFGDSSALPTYRVSELARRHVTVCLSGDGGDEVFAGYRRYLWHHREAQLRRLLPTRFSRPVFAGLARLYPKLAWAPRPLRAKQTFAELSLDPEEAYFASVSVTDDVVRGALLGPTLKRELRGYRASDVVRAHMRRAATDDPVQQAQYADLKTYLAGDILVKVDRASMANSLEVRTPLLEHGLVEWGLNLPTTAKIRGSGGKAVLKRAMAPYLPEALLRRPKMGFSLPLADWFRGPMRAELAALPERLRRQGGDLFDTGVVERLLTEHQGRRRDHAPVLWLLLVFDGYLQQVTGERAAETAGAQPAPGL